VQFFTNAIDTETRALGIVAEHTTRWPGSSLMLSGQIDFNRTKVAGRHSSSPVLSGAQLFDGALFNTFSTKCDAVKAAPFSQLGFTYCWETFPFGINGRSCYARVDAAL
jgi:hypothetical protein